MNEPRHQKLVSQTGFIGNVLSTGLTGGVCLAISLFIGYEIDEHLQSAPYGIMGGIFLGMAAAFVQTWKQLQESMSAFKREQKRTENKTTPL